MLLLVEAQAELVRLLAQVRHLLKRLGHELVARRLAHKRLHQRALHGARPLLHKALQVLRRQRLVRKGNKPDVVPHARRDGCGAPHVRRQAVLARHTILLPRQALVHLGGVLRAGSNLQQLVEQTALHLLGERAQVGQQRGGAWHAEGRHVVCLVVARVSLGHDSQEGCGNGDGLLQHLAQDAAPLPEGAYSGDVAHNYLVVCPEAQRPVLC
mmetsp:Transcript_14259/g.36477  ORF Transcript_14259/g.36477 Transcript_14259/m.36477 type:complete len:212 (+) Transcript_14259:142-777(+)